MFNWCLPFDPRSNIAEMTLKGVHLTKALDSDPADIDSIHWRDSHAKILERELLSKWIKITLQLVTQYGPNWLLGLPLLTWINFNPNMHK